MPVQQPLQHMTRAFILHQVPLGMQQSRHLSHSQQVTRGPWPLAIRVQELRSITNGT